MLTNEQTGWAEALAQESNNATDLNISFDGDDSHEDANGLPFLQWDIAKRANGEQVDFDKLGMVITFPPTKNFYAHYRTDEMDYYTQVGEFDTLIAVAAALLRNFSIQYGTINSNQSQLKEMKR